MPRQIHSESNSTIPSFCLKWFLWQSGCFQPGNILYQGEVSIAASVWWANPWGCWCSLSRVSPGCHRAGSAAPGGRPDTRTDTPGHCLSPLARLNHELLCLNSFPFWNSTLASNSAHGSPWRSCCPCPALGGSVGRGCRVGPQSTARARGHLCPAPAEGSNQRAQTKEPRRLYPLAHWPVHIYLFGYVLHRYLYIYIFITLKCSRFTK